MTKETRPPIPFSTDLRFPSDGLTLEGTLTLPGPAPPYPGALLLVGSGAVDRDENMPGLRFNVVGELAQSLAAAGIASFRFDKRGVGRSQGDFLSAGFLDNVSDAARALEVLRQRPEVDSARLFLIGHSEGAVIATRLGRQGADVAGIVMLSGTGQSGEEVLLWQGARAAEGLRGLNKWLVKIFRIDLAKRQRKQLERIKNSSEDVLRLGWFRKLNAKWFREFMAYDPSESFGSIRAPFLAITGAKDIQVNPADLERLAAVGSGLAPHFLSGRLPKGRVFKRRSVGDSFLLGTSDDVTTLAKIVRTRTNQLAFQRERELESQGWFFPLFNARARMRARFFLSGSGGAECVISTVFVAAQRAFGELRSLCC